MWRPKEGWAEVKIRRCIHRQGIPKAGIKPAGCDTCPTNINECQRGFEAGADAMLTALRETGERVFMIPPGKYGVRVFIPDEES